MTTEPRQGGIIHSYQKYDPVQFPPPHAPPPDLVSPAFEHLLAYGNLRELTEEELARAIRLDPSQIAGLGPSLDALRALLEERKRKLLETYETERVERAARSAYRDAAQRLRPPPSLAAAVGQALRQEQLRELERLWFRSGGEKSPLSGPLMQVIERLGDKYQIDELASKYRFTGRQSLSIPEALALKEELETIDRLLKQLDEAARTAQLGVIDLDELGAYAEPEQIENLNRLAEQIQEYLRQLAEEQGLERTRRGYQLSPRATRIFQGKLLEQIFSHLDPARSGRHTGPIVGEGAVELPTTRPYEFGDSAAQMDVPATFVNALLRQQGELPVRLRPEDIEIHRTRNAPKCATAVVMDMSGSMGRGGLYINVKRMALALEGLIRREYPGDYLRFIEAYSFAKPRTAAEIVTLLPKPVTIFDPWVRLKADMSRPDASEHRIPPHFTNLQHGLALARQFLSVQDTPNRQVILITDGLPTAHFEGQMLYLLYPPDPATERATLREGQLCRRDGITINIFLLPSWSQSHEDVQFAYRLAQTAAGRVFFTAGKDLDRYVVWDYVARKRTILG